MTRIELIDDWRKAWKFASVQLGLVWSAAIGCIVADPGFISNLWNQIPYDLRSELPNWLRGAVTAIVVLTTLLATRLLKKRPKDGTAVAEAVKPADDCKPVKAG